MGIRILERSPDDFNVLQSKGIKGVYVAQVCIQSSVRGVTQLHYKYEFTCIYKAEMKNSFI